MSAGRAAFGGAYLRGRWFDQWKGYRWIWLGIWNQKVLGANRHVPWPVSSGVRVGDPACLSFDPDDLNNFQSPNGYYQCGPGRIVIGRGTYIATNVGIITANHDPEDLERHAESKDVVIGERCWIGMNSVILPGVTLGPGTVVGAGSVVTKSFPAGRVVVGGNPARVIKTLGGE